jgi:hypothetical protein
MLKTRKGIINRIEDYQQVVITEDNDIHILRGMEQAKNVVEGDSVILTYRSGPSYGLWFATKEN